MYAHRSKLALERAGQHVGEQLQSDGQQQFHERYDQEDRERDQPQQIVGRSSELSSLSTGQASSFEQLGGDLAGNLDLGAEELGSCPVMGGFFFDGSPGSFVHRSGVDGLGLGRRWRRGRGRGGDVFRGR